ncbi:MAG: RNAse P, Rpr2/Rpp21 subunit [Nanoarchaeota archaeon]
MKKKLTKTRAIEEINEFFKNIKNKSPKEIKKIKRLAMSYNIPLKEKRKIFCKNCLNPYSGKEKIRIKNKIKNIECKNCGYISRWKLK